MIPHALRTLSVLVLAVVPCVGQAPTDTLPTGFLTGAGDTRHWVLGQFAPARAQTTYDASVVALPTGNVTRLWLRPDDDPASGAMAAHRLLVSIDLGSEGVPPPSHVLQNSYARNHGRDHTRVLDRAPVDFPAFTPDGSLTAWSVSLPIQPFPYVTGRNLQVEWNFEDPAGGSSTSPWFVDARNVGRRNGGGWFRRFRERDACPSQGTIYDGEVGGPGDICSVWFYSMSGPGLPAVTYFGSSDQAWDTVPLPIDLTGLGFSGCSIWTDLLVAVVGTTDPTGAFGRFRVDLPIPFRTSLAGSELYSQTFVLDQTFGGGLRASDGGKLHIGNFVGRLEARHLYSYLGPIGDRPEFASETAPILGVR